MQSSTSALAALLVLAAAPRAAVAQTVNANSVTLDTRACQPPFDALPFCDTARSYAERAADLVSRIGNSDVTPQLTARHGGGGSPGPASNISAIGLPEYDWGMKFVKRRAIHTRVLWFRSV